eukprot:scaffold5514_cov166-Ochromonas_danica.AAC.3
MTTIPRVNSSASELNDFTETIGVYLPVASLLLVGVLAFQLVALLYNHRFDLAAFMSEEVAVIEVRKPFVLDLGWQTMALLAAIVWYLVKREKPVYLIDFSVFEPPEDWKFSYDQLVTLMKNQKCFTDESLDFMARMVKQSGTGPATAWPPGILQSLDPTKSADRSVEKSREEAETIMYDCVERLLKSTGTNAKEIDILVINCSLFSPTPSLCSMVINKFGMRSDIHSYNLSGMGCSAGLISMDLVRNVLAGKPNAVALIVSTEIITPNLYHGNERPFLLQNTLFRCGGAAVLVTNRWTDALRARFKLLHLVRTQYVGEGSFGCVYETEDGTDHNYRGVRLSKDIVKIAGRAMEKNFTDIGPYVLPLSEQLKTAWSIARRAIAKSMNWGKVTPYIPDFTRGIDHFCIHAGGRGVIDGIEKNLNLLPRHVEASRHTLYKYGNTSSSSIWYELDYIRTRMDLTRGQRVMQLAFGSGFKCNSAVWLCLQNTPSTASDETSSAKAKQE